MNAYNRGDYCLRKGSKDQIGSHVLIVNLRFGKPSHFHCRNIFMLGRPNLEIAPYVQYLYLCADIRVSVVSVLSLACKQECLRASR